MIYRNYIFIFGKDENWQIFFVIVTYFLLTMLIKLMVYLKQIIFVICFINFAVTSGTDFQVKRGKHKIA